jgi:Pvc16 N-terminal domain/Carboxypeptidase regulatory-like domain
VIDPLDAMLRDLVQSRISTLAGPTQVGFAPPNADWKAAVAAAGEERISLYLYDMRENVTLRSNEWERVPAAGGIKETSSSPRLDCTYLVTAWSPVAITPALDPTREEHELLYKTLALLMHSRPLIAAEVYAANPTKLASVPKPLKDQPLPVAVVLPDTVKEPTEFWTTMKVDWKPAIHLTVTIPVVLDEPAIESPMVTTLTSRYGTLPPGIEVDSLMTVGGRVLKTADGIPVDGAWVQIAGTSPPSVTAVRQRLTTGADGRFIFGRLPPGKYVLRAVSSGIGAATSPVFDVPHPSGDYDLHLP